MKEEHQGMALSEGTRMRFDHISIAVESIDSAYEFFGRHFPIQMRNDKVPSDQVSGSFFWKDFWLGGFAVELIEDLSQREGFVTRFIRKHGQGFHHLSIEVNALDPLIERLRSEGVRVVDEQDFGDGSKTAFISPRSAFGVLIQFWQVRDFDEPHEAPPADGRARFDHAAIAVRDIDRALEFFQRNFPVRVLRPKHVSRSSGNFMLAQMEVAGFKLELIQSPPHPVADDFVGRFIERHGEGLHHISVDLANFDGALSRLKADGVRVVDERTNRHGRRQFFISPRSAFGSLIQVWDGV